MVQRTEASPNNSFLLRADRAQAEARRVAKNDLESRLRATTILDPNDVAGEYDASRGLITTLGGTPRLITIDDLRQFQHLVRQLGKKFRGGITAKQVIDLSVPDRRSRAQNEIKLASPIASRHGSVRFQTNSGPKSHVARHYQTIEFLNWNAVLASPAPEEKIVSELIKGKIRITCSCEDWRYQGYRYMATAGKYLASTDRPESGLPKIKNPNLSGAACKHLIRVCAVIAQSPTFKQYAINMLRNARKTLEGKPAFVKKAEMQEFADKLKKENYRQRRIATTDEKRAERARWASSKPVQDLKAKAAEKAKSKATKIATNAVEANIKKLLSLGAISQAQADAMRAVMKG